METSVDTFRSEIARWKAGVDALLVVPVSRLWPRCAGMAIMLDSLENISEDGSWVPGDALTFVSEAIVPAGHFTEVPQREVRYVVTSRPALRHGAITIGQPQRVIDFRTSPFDTRERGGWKITAGSDQAPLALNTSKESRLLRVLNRVTEGLNVAGMYTEDIWWNALRKRDHLKSRPEIPCGSTGVNHFPAPRLTFPVPYVTLPDLTPRSLIAAQTVHGVIPRPLIQAFCAAVPDGLPVVAAFAGTYAGVQANTASRAKVTHILRQAKHKETLLTLTRFAQISKHRGEAFQMGEVIGKVTLPLATGWSRKPLVLQWMDLRKQLGKELLLDLLAVFLERSVVELYGVRCVPYPLAAVYMSMHPEQLRLVAWNVAHLAPYLDPETEAFILPPLRQRRWGQFRFSVHEMDVCLARDGRISASPLPRPARQPPRAAIPAQSVQPAPVSAAAPAKAKKAKKRRSKPNRAKMVAADAHATVATAAFEPFVVIA